MATVITLVPRDGISVNNSAYNAATGKTSFGDNAKPTKFVLFTEDWIKLQNFVAGALNLPISQGDFVAKYGDFTKKELIQNAVGALRDLQDSAKEFGNPAVLWKEWANAPLTTEQPKSLYGRIVWLAGQIMTKAESFKDTYESLAEILSPKLPQAERLANLKEVLTGPGGLTDEAREMKGLCEGLRGDLAKFGVRIGNNQAKITEYFNSKAEIAKAAEAAVGDIQKKIDELTDERNTLQKQYEGAAGGAAGGAALIMIFSVGLAWPVALGVGLGLGLGLAETFRKNRDAVSDLIGKRETDKQKKVALQLDIKGLNSQIETIKDTVDAVAKGLGEITMVWDDQIVALESIVKSTDFDKMITYGAVNQRLKIDHATKKWHQIADDTKEFRHGALVQYQSGASQAA